MSNFCTETRRQTKLNTVCSKGSELKSNNLLSFFDMVSREKIKPAPKELPPLGLLAYMSKEDRQSYKTSSTNNDTSGSRNHQGIQKYTVSKCKNIWDNLDNLPSEKVPRPGTKGAVTLCSLLDLDSSTTTTDPWKEVETQKSAGPLSSTPHHKILTNKGPLDTFRTSANTNPWSFDTDSVNGLETRSTMSRKRQLTPASTNSRPVNSYFSKTKSIWQEFNLSSDEDIVCLSERAASVSSQSSKRKSKRPQKKRGQPKKSPAKSGNTLFSSTRILRSRTECNVKNSQSRQPTPNKPITSSDADVITISD